MLSIRDLQVSYGRAEAVRGVSVDVLKGEIVALLGTNGAGKTTLLSAVAGLVRASRGAITLDGEPLTNLRPEIIVRRGVALVPERRELFPEMSVAENLEIGAYLRRDRAAVRADMGRIYGYFPVLEPRRQQLASTLSGGQQQMLAIGRALMTRTKLLMIDEISLGLMPKGIDLCYGALEKLRREGLTILVVEQNTDRLLRVADELCVLESGRTVWQGKTADARGDPALTATYLGLH
jgi:branched-chain amino acid transport system ATP-binding protein